MSDHSIRMSDFVDDVHRAIDKAIVRDHETARRLLDSLDLPDDATPDATSEDEA